MWRSPVAQRSGGPEVASSNLVIPTKQKAVGINCFFNSKSKDYGIKRQTRTETCSGENHSMVGMYIPIEHSCDGKCADLSTTFHDSGAEVDATDTSVYYVLVATPSNGLSMEHEANGMAEASACRRQ